MTLYNFRYREWEGFHDGGASVVKTGSPSFCQAERRASVNKRRSHHEGRDKKGQYPRRGTYKS